MAESAGEEEAPPLHNSGAAAGIRVQLVALHVQLTNEVAMMDDEEMEDANSDEEWEYDRGVWEEEQRSLAQIANVASAPPDERSQEEKVEEHVNSALLATISKKLEPFVPTIGRARSVANLEASNKTSQLTNPNGIYQLFQDMTSSQL